MLAGAEGHQGAVTGPPALTPPGDALLDQPAAQIRVDQPVRGPVRGFQQPRVRHGFSSGEAGELLGFEYRRRKLLMIIYPTKWDSSSDTAWPLLSVPSANRPRSSEAFMARYHRAVTPTA